MIAEDKKQEDGVEKGSEGAEAGGEAGGKRNLCLEFDKKFMDMVCFLENCVHDDVSLYKQGGKVVTIGPSI